MAKMKSFRLLVLTSSFLGHGAAGRLVQPGSEIIMDLPLATKDITAEVDGEKVVVTKAGEPIVGANLEVLGPADGEAVESVPHGLPAGSIPHGDGRWLVPVGAGTTFELWQPGDPTTDLTRAPAEAFAANRAEQEASPAARFNPTDPRFNHDDKGGAGGSLSDEDMAAMLKGYGVEVPEGTSRPDMMRMLAAEKARRIPAAAPTPTAAERRAAAAAAQAAADLKAGGGAGGEGGSGGGAGTGDDSAPKPKRADITRELDELGVSYKPVGTSTDDLAKLLADEKAKRANA